MNVYVLPDSNVSRHIETCENLSIIVEMMCMMEEVQVPPMQIHVMVEKLSIVVNSVGSLSILSSENHDLYTLQSIIL